MVFVHRQHRHGDADGALHDEHRRFGDSVGFGHDLHEGRRNNLHRRRGDRRGAGFQRDVEGEALRGGGHAGGERDACDQRHRDGCRRRHGHSRLHRPRTDARRRRLVEKLALAGHRQNRRRLQHGRQRQRHSARLQQLRQHGLLPRTLQRHWMGPERLQLHRPAQNQRLDHQQRLQQHHDHVPEGDGRGGFDLQFRRQQLQARHRRVDQLHGHHIFVLCVQSCPNRDPGAAGDAGKRHIACKGRLLLQLRYADVGENRAGDASGGQRGQAPGRRRRLRLLFHRVAAFLRNRRGHGDNRARRVGGRRGGGHPRHRQLRADDSGGDVNRRAEPDARRRRYALVRQFRDRDTADGDRRERHAALRERFRDSGGLHGRRDCRSRRRRDAHRAIRQYFVRRHDERLRRRVHGRRGSHDCHAARALRTRRHHLLREPQQPAETQRPRRLEGHSRPLRRSRQVRSQAVRQHEFDRARRRPRERRGAVELRSRHARRKDA